MFIKQELSATAVKKIKSLKGKDLSLIEKVKYSSPTLVAKVVDPQLVSNDQKKIEQILYDSSCYYYKFHEQRREEVIEQINKYCVDFVNLVVYNKTIQKIGN